MHKEENVVNAQFSHVTLIKNEFMTLIFVRVIFEQALQKRMCAL
jgi:hypothetical protein